MIKARTDICQCTHLNSKGTHWQIFVHVSNINLVNFVKFFKTFQNFTYLHGKQDKNTEEYIFFFPMHATFNAMTMHLRFSD